MCLRKSCMPAPAYSVPHARWPRPRRSVSERRAGKAADRRGAGHEREPGARVRLPRPRADAREHLHLRAGGMPAPAYSVPHARWPRPRRSVSERRAGKAADRRGAGHEREPGARVRLPRPRADAREHLHLRAGARDGLLGVPAALCRHAQPGLAHVQRDARVTRTAPANGRTVADRGRAAVRRPGVVVHLHRGRSGAWGRRPPASWPEWRPVSRARGSHGTGRRRCAARAPSRDTRTTWRRPCAAASPRPS